LWKRPLYSVKLASNHFWVATIGILLYVVSMWTAGVTQGLTWRAVDATGELQYWSFLETVVNLIPYYWVRALGGTLYLAGLLMMAYNLYRTAFDPVTDRVKREWALGTGLVGAVVLALVSAIAISVYHIEWPQPRTATAQAAQERTLVEVGSASFRRMQCARCHGQRGEGGIANVNTVDGEYPRLATLAERLHLRDRAEAQAIINALQSGTQLASLGSSPPFETYSDVAPELARARDAIVNGRAARRLDPAGPHPEDMPAWGSRLQPQEVDALVAYLISLYPWE
jgi:mono/diheme cytochrome c family protein